ncbi:NnrU family protein [Croceicoccus mobilis]|uniref:NnrU domain-containing protein n=1 Tax=Croceicoccus mobilis TaxID=1703339 RepID=A0A916YTZ2_9SPHN|nr:NnrU family protein [Croceicoccus mobilis]GGD61281.1 hypothetical protein GCM10010990_08480 [Croceicoccus mobilis]
MDLRQSFLLSAAIVFVGSHVILSHQFRRPLMGWLGKMAFTAIYSLVAFITFGWTDPMPGRRMICGHGSPPWC